MSELAFFFPSSGPGGVQSIIIRLIKHAYSRNLPVIVLDFEGGYISEHIKCVSNDMFNKHVVIIGSIYDSSAISNHTFVAFNWQMSEAAFFVKRYNVNFIYWDVHSASLDQVLNICVSNYLVKKQKTNTFLSVLAKEGRVLTIDLVSKKLIEEKSKQDNIKVTGIPISSYDLDCDFLLPSPSDGLHVVYIARAVDWKVIPFHYCMIKVIEKYSNFTISCNIYTDNRKDFIKLLPDDSVFNLCKTNVYEGFSMDEVISRERGRVNLSMGMGTSQFELMLYGVPTLLIPATTSVFVLDDFDPLWSHMMPDYVYGFDDSTYHIFQRVEVKNNIGLSNAEFIWSDNDLFNVKKRADSLMQLYSCSTVTEILQDTAQEIGRARSNVWKLKELRIYLYWSALVGLVKKIIKV